MPASSKLARSQARARPKPVKTTQKSSRPVARARKPAEAAKAEWSVADAKARFSEFVEQARGSAQTLTRNGKPVAVMVGIEEWQRKAKPKGSLLEIFQSAPEGFADLDLTRSKDLPRDLDL